jgi:hypothetical protein
MLCVNVDCANMGMVCDPVTCDCVPELPTTTTTSTTTTSSTTTTTMITVVDHLKCYKVKDPTKLRGKVDLDSPQFGLEAGCTIKKAKKFCVPVKKTVNLSATTVNGQPVTLMPVPGQNLVDDYICYIIKCPSTPPPPTNVKDQFATRTLQKFRAFELCVPAQKVP